MKHALLGLSIVCLMGCSAGEEEQRLEDASYAIGYELGQGLATSGWRELDQEALWSGLQAGLKGEDAANAERAGAVFAQLQAEQQQRMQQQAEQARREGARYLSDYLSRDETRESTLGVGFRVLERGVGSYPQLSDRLWVSYRLETVDGALVEEVAAEEPMALAFGQMIPAWEEALRQMLPGEQRELIVPPAAGYGDLRLSPALPPGATLRFVLRLHQVEGNSAE